jgi:hypothetical protein
VSPDLASPLPAGRSEWIAAAAIAGVVLLSSTLFHPKAQILLPGVVALLLVVWGGYPWRRALALIWRLKWFYLSLLVFFGWMHPSVEPGPSQSWLPSVLGLVDAGTRIGALMLLVGWVVWLTSAFERGALIAGLALWLAPLRPLGVRGDVFAGRLFLVLAEFESHHSSYREFRAARVVGRGDRLKAGREFLVQRLARALSGDTVIEAPAVASAVTGGELRTRCSALLIGQVGLLWVAVFGSLLVRETLRGSVGG